ncbi:RNA polymerase sigma factor [Sinomicrobium weinanense]|uniref:RNA polymerase sigma-70 factor n=1 Tax=Sinomicrobium weinanense TaxID=2842200 RepID=A0A926Q2S7_9FLAO|nr:RNA polymerase sigma-70 factor [Sinomicrobium weinanense]MBC9796838.1 RNA polymerase sigma-70 factor [Sinomicrobium weinanense]MBU3125211.1 RNA polymerase sigma-70 factor [Sinomicrobium weinanense]
MNRKSPLMSDEELLVQLKQKNQAAFEEIFNRYWKRLFSYAYKIYGDEAVCEDMVQEIFIRLWERSEELSVKNLEGYLFRAVKYKLANSIRDLKFTVQHTDALSGLSTIPSVNRQMEYQELEKEVFVLVDRLPYRCKEVFCMSRVDSLTNAEIAEKLDISVRTVETHISNALKYLKMNLHIASWCFIAVLFLF